MTSHYSLVTVHEGLDNDPLATICQLSFSDNRVNDTKVEGNKLDKRKNNGICVGKINGRGERGREKREDPTLIPVGHNIVK